MFICGGRLGKRFGSDVMGFDNDSCSRGKSSRGIETKTFIEDGRNSPGGAKVLKDSSSASAGIGGLCLNPA